jgi:hypothetical protein
MACLQQVAREGAAQVVRAIAEGHTVTMNRGDNPTRGALVPLSKLMS